QSFCGASSNISCRAPVCCRLAVLMEIPDDHQLSTLPSSGSEQQPTFIRRDTNLIQGARNHPYVLDVSCREAKKLQAHIGVRMGSLQEINAALRGLKVAVQHRRQNGGFLSAPHRHLPELLITRIVQS